MEERRCLDVPAIATPEERWPRSALWGRPFGLNKAVL